MSVRAITVLWSNLEKRGKGVEGDIMRRVSQLWTLDGHLICEFDCGPTGSEDKMLVNEKYLNQVNGGLL